MSLVVPGPIRSQIVANSRQSANRLVAYAAWRTPFLSGWQQAYGQAEDASVVAETV